jgi:hypothetical protein
MWLMRTLCGAWIKLCVGRASEADQSEPAHTSAFSGILDASSDLLPAPDSKEGTTLLERQHSPA